MKSVSVIANRPLVLAKQKMIFSRYLAFISLALLSLVSTDVNCGAHTAASCEECVYDSNGDDRGRGWCNGECVWNNADNMCAAPTEPTDAPTALPTVDPTDAPRMPPTKAPTSNSECVDTAFMYDGKKTCAELLGGKPD